MNNFDLSNFVLIGNNRKQAYEDFIEFEKDFNDENNIYLDMTYKEFCENLDKGYGNSNCIQIARLYESKDGKVWYDNEYCG